MNSAANHELCRTTMTSQVPGVSDRAFEVCCGLKEISFPNSATEVGDHTFYRCTVRCSSFSSSQAPLPTPSTILGPPATARCSSLSSSQPPLPTNNVRRSFSNRNLHSRERGVPLGFTPFAPLEALPCVWSIACPSGVHCPSLFTLSMASQHRSSGQQH
jgi:hypothetical protein